MNRWAVGNWAACILGLSALLLTPPMGVLAQETGERPKIVVPRRGGEVTFRKYCVLCHRYDGRGGPSEGGYAADLRKTLLTEELIVWTIVNGRRPRGMPAFQGIINDAGIKAVAKYIKEQLPKTLKEEPPNCPGSAPAQPKASRNTTNSDVRPAPRLD